MLGVGYELLWGEVVDAEGFEMVFGYGELECALGVLLAFLEVVDVDCLNILPQHIQIPIRRRYITHLRLLMPHIRNIRHNLMPNKIHQNHLILPTLQYHQIEIIPIISISINDKCSCERADSTIVLVLFGYLAGHGGLLPAVNALGDMGEVGSVLEVIDEDLATVLLHHVGVEECYILWPYTSVQMQRCAINLIHPINRSITLPITRTECNIRS